MISVANLGIQSYNFGLWNSVVYCKFLWAFVFTSFLKSGNFNLVYSIIRKRNLFHQLANLPTDVNSIQKALQKKSRSNSTPNAVFMETNNPYNTACSEGPYKTTPVQTGTLNASLKAMPRTQPTSSYTVALFHLSMLTIKSPVAVSIHIFMQIVKYVKKAGWKWCIQCIKS